jgi:hypothetical protein
MRERLLIFLTKPILVGTLLAWAAAPASSADLNTYTIEQVNGHVMQGDGGSVDKIDTTDSGKKLQGWAADITTKKPARSVQIFVNGANAGAFPCTIDRTDVSQALGVSDKFGFVVDVSAKPTDAVKVFAEQNDGSFVEISPN